MHGNIRSRLRHGARLHRPWNGLPHGDGSGRNLAAGGSRHFFPVDLSYLGARGMRYRLQFLTFQVNHTGQNYPLNDSIRIKLFAVEYIYIL